MRGAPWPATGPRRPCEFLYIFADLSFVDEEIQELPKVIMCVLVQFPRQSHYSVKICLVSHREQSNLNRFETKKIKSIKFTKGKDKD